MIPAGLRVYAIGDVHGCLTECDRLLDSIREDAESALTRGVACRVVFLGDVIDRGPDSRGVLDRVIGGLPDALPSLCLLGNHEAGLRDFLADPVGGAGWLLSGGVETLASYGVRTSVGITGPKRLADLAGRVAAAIPDVHRQFIARLPPLIEIGDYAFVHAGVRPGRALDRQRPEDLIGIRGPFLSSTRWHGRMIVHGHTVVDQPVVTSNRIGIDTGAYRTGRLTALVVEGEERRFLYVG